MATQHASIQGILQQPLSVDFIEKKLPEVDDAFKNLHARYDPAAGRFVPQTPRAAHPRGQQPQHAAAGRGTMRTSPPPRQKVAAAIEAMQFWDRIFAPARSAFLAHAPVIPKKLQEKPEYSVRELETWNEIYERLQSARVKYDGSKFQFLGRVKSGLRRLVDGKLQIAQRLGQMIPDLEYVSPVKAAVEIVLDAVQTASKAREIVVSAQDAERLTAVLAKVETFLTVFPADANIEDASIELVVCILQAIEGIIVFFLSSSGHRAWNALIRGEGYQKPLLDIIRGIEAQSNTLMQEAHISNMYGNSAGISKILDGLDEVQLYQTRGQEGLEVVINGHHLMVEQNRQVIEKIDLLSDRVDQLWQRDADLANVLMKLLNAHEKEWLGKGTQSTLRSRHSDEESSHSATPSRSASPMSQYSYYHHPISYCSTSLAVPGTYPAPPNYQQWPYPPLTPWQYPPFPCPPYHMSFPPLQGTIAAGSWIGRPRIVGLDKRDVESVIEDGESIPLRHRSSASDILHATEFRRWIASLTSTELLVLGGPDMESHEAALALSLVCAHITRSVHQRENHRYLALVFFCAQHVDVDDEHAGPRALMQSLICQLLEQQQQQQQQQQQTFAPHVSWDPSTQEAVEHGDVAALCAVFRSLMQQLPPDRTVMCVIDGASCYETEQYEREMEAILSCLLGLRWDPAVVAVVKCLVTCATGTMRLHRLFPDEHLPLMLESLLSFGEDLTGGELQLES